MIFSQVLIVKAINKKVKGIIQNNNENVILHVSTGFKEVEDWNTYPELSDESGN